MDIIKNYIDEFNRNDVETIKNDIDNAHVYEWMKAEVPVFECPDKEIERAYYFRFRNYRKYIKTTKDDIVITELSCCDRNEKRAVGMTALFLTNQNLSGSIA